MPQFTAISPEQFTHKAWKRSTGYTFAAQAHTLPIVAAELSVLVPAMPLGFVQHGEAFQLVAITALQPNTNLFIAPDGRWLSDYVPSSLRGYPFQLIKLEGQEESALCFDEDSGLLVAAGEGVAFFDDSGTPGQEVKDVLEFLYQCERSRVATAVAVNTLQAAGLIHPWSLSVKSGEKIISVEGLYHIDETALNALPDHDFVALRKTGALPVAYSQLLSMNRLSVLQKLDQMQAQIKEQALKSTQPIPGLEGFRLSLDDDKLKFNF